MKEIIHLTGLPRSGSTLLSNILANNPKIGGGETSPLLEYIYSARANYSSTPEVKSALTEDVMKKSFLNFCYQGMQGYASTVTDKPIYLDKSRGWLHYAPFLWEINPKAKIIVCVRDLRGVVSSMEKKWRQNPSIMDMRASDRDQQFITVDQRVQGFLNDAPIGIALKRLYNAVQTGTIENMHIVKHEDLAKNPEKVMREVYKFLEMEYCELDYSNIKQMTVENDRIGDFGIYGDHKIRKEVKPLEKDYKQVLGDHLSRQIVENYKWFYDAFGYF